MRLSRRSFFTDEEKHLGIIMNIYQPLLHEGSVVRLIWLAINFELATTLGVHRCCQELELQAHRSIL